MFFYNTKGIFENEITDKKIVLDLVKFYPQKNDFPELYSNLEELSVSKSKARLCGFYQLASKNMTTEEVVRWWSPFISRRYSKYKTIISIKWPNINEFSCFGLNIFVRCNA